MAADLVIQVRVWTVIFRLQCIVLNWIQIAIHRRIPAGFRVFCILRRGRELHFLAILVPVCFGERSE